MLRGRLRSGQPVAICLDEAARFRRPAVSESSLKRMTVLNQSDVFFDHRYVESDGILFCIEKQAEKSHLESYCRSILMF